MAKDKKIKLTQACLQIKVLNNLLKETQRKRDKLIAKTLKEHRMDSDMLNREYKLIAK